MSKKPKKPEASARDRQAAKDAIYKSERYDKVWRPLEQSAIAELTTADAGKRSAMLAGRSNADLESAVAGSRASGLALDVQSNRGYGSGNTVAAQNNNTTDAMSGKQGLLVASDQKARDSMDTDTLNVIKTGQDMSRSTGSTLTKLARTANQVELGKWANKNSRDQAKASAMTEVATSAMIAGYGAYKQGTSTMTGVDGKQKYTFDSGELGWGGQKMRDQFGGLKTAPVPSPSNGSPTLRRT